MCNLSPVPQTLQVPQEWSGGPPKATLQQGPAAARLIQVCRKSINERYRPDPPTPSLPMFFLMRRSMRGKLLGALLLFSDGIKKDSPPGTTARGLGTRGMKCLHFAQLSQGFPRTKPQEYKDQTKAAKGIKELGDD